MQPNSLRLQINARIQGSIQDKTCQLGNNQGIDNQAHFQEVE